jgi:putative Ca2+/H+ antiporter (TMEM165/GDT1 family)
VVAVVVVLTLAVVVGTTTAVVVTTALAVVVAAVPAQRMPKGSRQARLSTTSTLLMATGAALAVAKKARIGKRAYIVG